jgi:hypothetical protein
MNLSITGRSYAVKGQCPPKTWQWLLGKVGIKSGDVPHIAMFTDSELHCQFRKRAWDECHERKLQNPS